MCASSTRRWTPCQLARQHPERQVVFFAIGFETTAPANAMAVLQAERLGLDNFSVLVAHVLVPPAIRAVLDSPRNLVQGFLAAGHVCAVMGMEEYRPLVAQYRVPIVVTGFEPLDILQGVYQCVRQLEQGRAEVENAVRAGRPAGGQPGGPTQIRRVFTTVVAEVAGDRRDPRQRLGTADGVRPVRRRAAVRVCRIRGREPAECMAGAVLQGQRKPHRMPGLRRAAARPNARWALRWFRPKAPARRTTATGDWGQGVPGHDERTPGSIRAGLSGSAHAARYGATGARGRRAADARVD